MPQDVHRHLDGAVSHLVPKVGQALALLNQQRRERVPQVMEANPPQAEIEPLMDFTHVRLA
jgi:hypothetical protein